MRVFVGEGVCATIGVFICTVHKYASGAHKRFGSVRVHMGAIVCAC